MKEHIGCSCCECHHPVRPVRHFVADDGRILCRTCRMRLKASGRMKQTADDYQGTVRY